MNGKPDPADLVLLGVVTGVRGLKGDLRIKSFTADPEDLAAYGPLWDEAGEVSYWVRVIGEVKGHLIARIKGVSNRTAAETLKGLKLHIYRSALPDPEEDEFYHSDLIGLQVVTTSGEVWGRSALSRTLAPAMSWKSPADPTRAWWCRSRRRSSPRSIWR